MAIDFNNLNSSQGSSGKSNGIAKQPGNSGNSSNAKSSGDEKGVQSIDSLSLSKQAEFLQKVESQLKELPDTNQEKIQQLRSDIESGSYRIDPSKLANNLIGIEINERDH